MARKHDTDLPAARRRRPLSFVGREGLGAYLEDPASFPPSRVISHSDKWVVINDLYPKSSVHVLLLPRDRSKVRLHPLEALADPAFFAEVRVETKRIRALVANELRRRYGRYSAQEQERRRATTADPVPDELPPGRDWDKEVVSGIHAGPSMSHLHIHILSVDRVSECVKKKNHYNSFSTPFFVLLDEFPLDRLSRALHARHGYLESDLVCWRCGENFGNRFTKLKLHLADELELWRSE